MELNPLGWTAGPFLALYVLVAGAALLWIYNAGNNLAPRAGGDAAGLDPVQLGYLAGGEGRATDTALVGLFQAGAAVLEKGAVRFDTSMPVPPAFAPFRHASGNRAACHAAFKGTCERIRAELARRGLVPDDERLRLFRTGAWCVLAVPLVLGMAKAVVGASRDRPIGILMFLMLVTAVLGAGTVMRRPSRNAAGSAVLAQVRLQQARAARAPMPSEVALAFALTGTAAVVAEGEYRAFLRQSGGDGGGDSGSGSSGSGDGGGGCGGCSG